MSDNKQNQSNSTDTGKSKTRFIVTREYSGSQTMREAFEKAIESRACGQFEQWIQSQVS